MQVEIHDLAELRDHIEVHRDLKNTVIQGVDLRGSTLLDEVSAEGAVLLGCQLDDGQRDRVLASGGLLFPRLPDLPFQPYRTSLYTVEELTEGHGDGRFEATLDYRIYQFFQRTRHHGRVPIVDALAQRLHDHAIDNALQELMIPDTGAAPRVVAIMGGHALARTDPGYRRVAEIGRGLARRGYLVASGGGPGAMEASHLGAWLSSHPDDALDRALEMMSRAPGYHDAGWHHSAFEVRAALPSQVVSLGIPTWFYGHEPPSLFASHIAKYFSNSLREDGLLAIARCGVVYTPGSAGTVQEIFMDAAQNHYGTFSDVSPMVFLGRKYWSEDRPVMPLLERLAGRRQYADLFAAVDTPEEVVEFIDSHPPVPYRP